MVKAKLSDRQTQVRFARFIVVGGGSLVVQLLVMWALKRVATETVAFSISWVVSTTTHYLANRFWALPSARHDSGKQLAEYLFTVAVSYIINVGMFKLLRDVLGWDVLIATAAAVPPSTVVVFLLLNYRVFKAKKV